MLGAGHAFNALDEFQLHFGNALLDQCVQQGEAICGDQIAVFCPVQSLQMERIQGTLSRQNFLTMRGALGKLSGPSVSLRIFVMNRGIAL